MPMRDEHVLVALKELATTVRDAVLPLAGDQRLAGETEGGDVMSLADQRSAHAVRRWCETQKHFRCSLQLEETGRFEDVQSNPKIRLIVDEIDGTRPFRAGLPTACVCVGAVPADWEPTLQNVRWGAMAPFTGGMFLAVRSKGAWFNDTRLRRLTDRVPLERAITFFDLVGAPLLPLAMSLRPFWGSAPYGLMSLASFSYSATRLALGQAHLYLHLIRELPRVFPLASVKHGQQYGGVYPWDLAGPAPILAEVGCIMTTARGESLTEFRVDDTSKENTRSLVVSTHPELHEQALKALEEGWKDGTAKDAALADLV